MIRVRLTDQIGTSFSGYRKLVRFYQECAEHTNDTVSIDFYDLEWIDGNQAALFDAILYKLTKDNGLRFSTDFEFLKKKFDVLFRNGFLVDGEAIEDDRKSTVPVKNFSCEDKKGFIQYVERDLMKHRGMPTSLSKKVREKIIDDLIEIFCNAHHHANTKDPFFVAGQYYPRAGELRFTMVDLGDGFLPRIEKATNGKITTSLEAISWAVKGNSSKLAIDGTSGGLGLKGIHKYCTANEGVLDIATGDGYWSSSYANGTIFSGGRSLGPDIFAGTAINLTFQST